MQGIQLPVASLPRVLAAMALICVSGGAYAAGLDGSRNVVCAAVDVVACAPGKGCMQGAATDFELPEFIFVDVKAKAVRARTEGVATDIKSPIRLIEKSEGQVVLQGFENGNGWTITIDQSSGRMTTTVSGARVSFMIFGACTAL